jgi:8-oxo-dGTP pyrophosphatase MutT (NUDIX family)
LISIDYYCPFVSAATFAANPRPAATVVVLRDTASGPEVFMVRRHQGTAFMGGAHVFPGGRVDAADRGASSSWCDGTDEAAARLADLPADEAVAYYLAGVRELFEESGVLLAREPQRQFVRLAEPAAHARFTAYRHDVHDGRVNLRTIVEREGLRVALDALALFAHWVTPPVDTRQFDTRFFMTRVPPEQAPAHDETETTHSVWLTPSAALAQARAREIVLPPPTWSTLREIERFESVDAALAWASARRVTRREPVLVVDGGTRMLLMPGDPEHPDDAGDEPPAETRFVFGDGRWLPRGG